jgi:uncharacterized protein
MELTDEMIYAIEEQIKKEFAADSTGHDWWHIHRVIKNALAIAQEEGAKIKLVHVAALLHDVGDHKFHHKENAADTLITNLLSEYKFSADLIQEILEIVKSVSFKGAGVSTIPQTLEAKCVQDADRLDAIGAIGIARAFAFGGNRNRLLYDPSQPPTMHNDFEAYKKDKGHTINHFYEKLLLIKDRMQTETGRKLAEERHHYMEQFLAQFYKEWNCT